MVYICLFILVMLPLVALTAPDIAMFAINVQNNCTVGTEGGESLSKWMYGMSITHFLMVSTMLCMGGLVLSALFVADMVDADVVDEAKWCSIVMSGCCCLVYLVLFGCTVKGFMLQEEIRFYGVNNEQCNEVLLAWCIISLFSYCGALCFVVCAVILDRWLKLVTSYDWEWNP